MAIITSGRAYYQSLTLSLTKCKCVCVCVSRGKKRVLVELVFLFSLTLKWGESSNFRTNLVDLQVYSVKKQSPHAGTTNTLIYMIIKMIQKNSLSLQCKMRRGSIYTVWRVKSGLQIVIAQSILANKCFGKLSLSLFSQG